MTATNGFPPSAFAFLNGPEIGGPMTISNGYRWNVSVVSYGFDPSFLNYFGSNGVTAVESAISLLNNLPPASQLNPASFRTDTTHVNDTAESCSLADLKSETLFLLLEHLGLASPDLYVFTLKNFAISNGVVTGDVLLRNFDPITHLPTNYVNTGQLTYHLDYFVNKGVTNAQIVTFPTAPLSAGPAAVADGVEHFGDCYYGLTSDDAGGLKYLYSPKNVAYETLLPDVRALKSPGVKGGVNGAWRMGVDKVTFVPQPVNPITRAYETLTCQFLSTYLTNHLAIPQLLERTIAKPDFLFSAADFAAGTTWYDRTGTTNWINNAALNGRPSAGGPGVIPPPVNLVFNKLGPEWLDPQPDDQIAGSPPYEYSDVVQACGTFDGTTNPPIIYPEPKSGTNQTPVRLTLYFSDNPVNFRWLATGTNHDFSFQTSTNLTDWTTLFLVPNNGSLSYYLNSYPDSPRRFYRVVPQ